MSQAEAEARRTKRYFGYLGILAANQASIPEISCTSSNASFSLALARLLNALFGPVLRLVFP